jgi:hypothetical protein
LILAWLWALMLCQAMPSYGCQSIAASSLVRFPVLGMDFQLVRLHEAQNLQSGCTDWLISREISATQ